MATPTIHPSLRRWTIGRVVTDLAIILVAVPLAVEYLAPRPRGSCATDEWTGSVAPGLMIIGVRATWFLILKPLNDDCERWLNQREAARSLRKPPPTDDF